MLRSGRAAVDWRKALIVQPDRVDATVRQKHAAPLNLAIASLR
jgi:hypothetical protein